MKLIDLESLFAERKYNSRCQEGVDQWKFKVDATVSD